MAIEFYISLTGVGPAESAMRSANAQLEPYRSYLARAIKAANERALSLAWRTPTKGELSLLQERLANRLEERDRHTREANRRRDRWQTSATTAGEWIVIEPRGDRGEEPESTFEAFFAAKGVYDAPLIGSWRSSNASIDVRDADEEVNALLLSRLPNEIPHSQDGESEPALPALQHLFLRPNTWPLECQRRAVDELKDSPVPQRAPLIRLTTPSPDWPAVEGVSLDRWIFLRDEGRDGTEEQREFVRIALGTPDFAILEGPSGSGKTTAICELICQLARQGKRVLLTASTHVAVDNVLEKLIAWQDSADEELVMPIRIGDERKVSSPEIEPWVLKRLLPTWKGEILDFLDAPQNTDPRGDEARRTLGNMLKGSSPGFERLILDASNLVCGTTIGILQHPAIRNKDAIAPFDVMILDEASKTTFSEFLVPALHAGRWIVVGDRRQLSPYVEVEDLEENLRALVDKKSASATAHAFLASRGRPERSLVSVDTKEEARLFISAADKLDVIAVDLDGPDIQKLLPCASIVCGRASTIKEFEHRLPGDINVATGSLPDLPDWRAHCLALGTERREEPVDWAHEIAWRLIRAHELRDSRNERDQYDRDLRHLQPEAAGENGSSYYQDLGNLRRVTLPSILEILQRGALGLGSETVLTAGMPTPALRERLVSLSFQHRMHPDISAFPRQQFYHEDGLLKDASDLVERREWAYRGYASHATWIDIQPQRDARQQGNSNLAEASAVMRELRAFRNWADQTPKPGKNDSEPWDVAVLTFYRGQEKELRQRLRKECGQPGHGHTFWLGQRVRIKLGTVDRFQGHEADLVLLSFVKSAKPGFLNSPNRMNVALTRARYQLVLIGNRRWMASESCRSDLLRALGSSEHYTKNLGWEPTQP